VIFAILALSLSNILTIIWALKTRIPLKVSKKVQALSRAIAAFEVEGQAVLRIERIPPDLVFLRNPN
jgi:hypothetical protein